MRCSLSKLLQHSAAILPLYENRCLLVTNNYEILSSCMLELEEFDKERFMLKKGFQSNRITLFLRDLQDEKESKKI